LPIVSPSDTRFLGLTSAFSDTRRERGEAPTTRVMIMRRKVATRKATNSSTTALNSEGRKPMIELSARLSGADTTDRLSTCRKATTANSIMIQNTTLRTQPVTRGPSVAVFCSVRSMPAMRSSTLVRSSRFPTRRETR